MSKLTKEQILNMPAGREMDVIVLRDILKYKPDYVEEGSLFGKVGELNCWYDQKTGRFVPLGTSPSEDIAVSVKAIDAMIEKYDCDIDVGSTKVAGVRSWFCRIQGGRLAYDNFDCVLIARAETAPLAICRVLLLAVMEADE